MSEPESFETVGRVAAAVVVQDDQHPGAGVAEVVERLVGHAAGERAVADHRHDDGARSVLAAQLEGRGDAVRVAERGRGVRVLDQSCSDSAPLRVAREAALLRSWANPHVGR